MCVFFYFFQVLFYAPYKVYRALEVIYEQNNRRI